ncbi:MAG TPA: ABC transporter permease [Anditalea sp.]|nr:ABC transporter permease [Anditalea sp.]
MIKHDLIIAFRNIFSNKTYSFINLIGLSVGMGCCFLIILYVQHEVSFDNFHQNPENIYRLTYYNSSTPYAKSPPPLAKALSEELSGISAAARMYERSASIELKESDGSNKFNEDNFYFVDPEIFEILSFRFIAGNPSDLTEPFALGINQQMAAKIFGKENPINKELLLDGDIPFTVKAVLEDFPSNSHIHFNFLSNFETMYKVEGEKAKAGLENNWVASHSFTYLLLDPDKDPDEINAQIPALLDNHVQESFRDVLDFSLQPIGEIHLDGTVQLNPEPTGSMTYIYLFSAIAFLIILIACINFINLAIANSMKRVKEVGVRKVMGANKNQLVKRFMLESIIICVAAFIVSIFLIDLGIPLLNSFTERTLQFEDVLNGKFIISVIALFTITTLLAGSYPAFIASRYEPASVLKGNTGTGTFKTNFLGKFLVTFQFTISIILISGSLLIYKQLQFFQNKNLGFEKDLIISVPVKNQNINNVFKGITPETRERMKVFENSLLNNPKIKASTLSFEIPGRGAVSNIAIPEGFSADDNMFTAFLAIDYDFIETYGLKIIEGRGFSEATGTDHIDAMVINESAVKKFGWTPEEAIGKSFHLFKPGVIIGVVEDFHTSSLRDNIEPLGMAIIPSMFNYFSIKIEDGSIPSTIQYIQQLWEKSFPEKAFEYSFVDQELDTLYRSEQNLGKLINIFSILAIIISCLGLFGLVSFTISNRSKEIGIRKVLGASISSISFLISKDYISLVILSNLIALPLSYYLLKNWLDQFNNKINLLENSWIFLFSGLLIFIIAMLTINSKAISAANSNPRDSLSNE